MDPGVYDASSLSTYVSCPRLYYWRYVRHLLPKGYKSAPLDFGTAIHEALRLWYTTGDIQVSIDAFHDLWDERFGDKKRTHEKGIQLIEEYAEEYPEEVFTWVSEPEQTFKLDFFGDTFVGRFDGVINFQGDVYIIDHKTATKMGGNYFYQFRPNMQMSAYIWAANQLYPDLEVKGAFLNILYFTITKTDFFRDLVYREPWEIREFLDVASRNIQEIKTSDREDHRDWEPRWAYCQHWGTCKYRDLCTEKDPEPLVDHMYRVQEWDPEEEFDLEKKKKKLSEYEEEPRLFGKDNRI